MIAIKHSVSLLVLTAALPILASTAYADEPTMEYSQPVAASSPAAPVAEATPVTMSEAPVPPVAEDAPAPMDNASPPPTAKAAPAPTDDTPPAPVAESEPAPTLNTLPQPVAETAPVPVNNVSPPPMANIASQPVVGDPPHIDMPNNVGAVADKTFQIPGAISLEPNERVTTTANALHITLARNNQSCGEVEISGGAAPATVTNLSDGENMVVTPQGQLKVVCAENAGSPKAGYLVFDFLN